ncbi:MAG: hypothetical protein FWG64_00865 [Firmicutes bacterium]|nr:hypothetical protein [Bacillota bacterium]
MTPNNIKALTKTNQWAYGHGVIQNTPGEFALVNFPIGQITEIRINTVSLNTGYFDVKNTPIYQKDIILRDNELFLVYESDGVGVLANLQNPKGIPLQSDAAKNGVVISNLFEILITSLPTDEEYQNQINKQLMLKKLMREYGIRIARI